MFSSVLVALLIQLSGDTPRSQTSTTSNACFNGLSDLRSAVHLHGVASVWEVLVTEPGTVGGQVQPSAGEVPLLKKGHLARAERTFVKNSVP